MKLTINTEGTPTQTFEVLDTMDYNAFCKGRELDNKKMSVRPFLALGLKKGGTLIIGDSILSKSIIRVGS